MVKKIETVNTGLTFETVQVIPKSHTPYDTFLEQIQHSSDTKFKVNIPNDIKLMSVLTALRKKVKEDKLPLKLLTRDNKTTLYIEKIE